MVTTITVLSRTTISSETREATEIVVEIVSSSPVGVGFRFRSWTLRTPRNLLFLLLLFPWIITIFLSVNWYDWFLWDTAFAYWADHNIARLVHPGVDARPTVQMSAFAHDRLLSLFKANITLETWSTCFISGASLRLCARWSLWLFTLFCCRLNWPWRGLMGVLLRGVEPHATYVNAFFRKDCLWFWGCSALSCFFFLLLLSKVFRCYLYNHLLWR